MSDFDKEAERERLREQYEREQQKREATERMSELLLKGATMTNAHCEDCGDPIFRYDGQEFCPSCQRVVAEDGEAAEGEETAAGADAQSADQAADAAADASDETAGAGEAASGGSASEGAASAPEGASDDQTPEHIEIKQPTGPAADEEATGETAATDANGEQSAVATGDRSGAPAQSPAQGERPAESAPRSAAQSRPAPRTSGARAAGEPAGQSGDDLSAARQSLLRALANHARRAETTEDPRRAKDHLAAAREAAEALSALPY